MAMACRAAKPVALGKTVWLVSPVTFNAPSAKAAPIEWLIGGIWQGVYVRSQGENVSSLGHP
jgi:hypothetical protein